MEKVMRIGTIETRENGRRASVFVKVEYDEGKLSISGVVGPLPTGNALGGCGQISMDFAHRDPKDNDGRCDHPIPPDAFRFAPGWTADKWLDLLDAWENWHCNDTQAGCEHQRALGWDKEPIDPSQPTSAYGKFYPGQKQDSWNLKGWVHPPHGHLCEPCPTCGYKYGTEWKRKEVPSEVITFLSELPNADKEPAWV